MKLCVFGAGAIGGLMAAKLAAKGDAEVTVIARGPHLDAIRDQGLRIASALGDLAVRPAQASADPASVGAVDLVIFAVKLYDTEAAAEACRPLVGQATGVVTFQNGVDSPEVLARVLGREQVIGGVAQIAAVVAAPGSIKHTGTMARFAFGELGGRRSARVEALAAAMRAAGVEHVVSEAIEREIWAKMVFLATFAGLTTLVRLPIGPIRADADTRALYRDGLAEALAVARAQGIELAEDFVAQTLARTDQLPAAMKSSMLEDLERGKRLELPWLSGAIVRMGAERGVPTPVHGFITTALKLRADGHG